MEKTKEFGINSDYFSRKETVGDAVGQLKSVLSVRNIGVYVYIIVNFILYFGVVDLFFANHKVYFNSSIVVYFAVIALSFTKLGDIAQRFIYRAERVDERSVTYAYFEDLIFRAKEKGYDKAEGIELYISDKTDTYAKAVSKKAIIINGGFFKLDDFQQQSLLGKELGTILENSIYLEVLMKISNFVYFLLFLIYECYYFIISALCVMCVGVVNGSKNNSENSFFGSFALGVLLGLFFEKLKSLGIFIKNLLIRFYLKEKEFKTDVFVVKLGLQNEIFALLHSYPDTGKKTSFFNALPSIVEREEFLKAFIAKQ